MNALDDREKRAQGLAAGTNPENESETKGEHKSGSSVFPVRKFFLNELPLQNTTSIFIFVNTLDIFMTYILMRFGAIEANPVANVFMNRWGFVGLIVFKLLIVALVCVIAQVVAMKKPGTARGLLVVGSVFVAIVVLYSAILFIRHFM